MQPDAGMTITQGKMQAEPRPKDPEAGPSDVNSAIERSRDYLFSRQSPHGF